MTQLLDKASDDETEDETPSHNSGVEDDLMRGPDDEDSGTEDDTHDGNKSSEDDECPDDYACVKGIW